MQVFVLTVLTNPEMFREQVAAVSEIHLTTELSK